MGFADRAIAEYAIADTAERYFLAKSSGIPRPSATGQVENVEIKTVNVSNNKTNISFQDNQIVKVINKGQAKTDFYEIIPIKAVSKASTKSVAGMTESLEQTPQNKIISKSVDNKLTFEDIEVNNSVISDTLVSRLYVWGCYGELNEDENETQIDSDCN